MGTTRRRAAVPEEKPSFLESCKEKWSKGLKAGAAWDKDTFEDFPVCVHWFRQMMSVIVGVVWGAVAMQGWPGFVG
ncbi:unnamed protein product [Choristocarpus tenellus]